MSSKPSQTYRFAGYDIDSVELKCLLISRGLKISPAVYKRFSGSFRLYRNALTCNCLKLPDETIIMATDISFHLATLSSLFSWENLKLLQYVNEMKTDFHLELMDDRPMLLHQNEEICPVSFMPGTDFFRQKTSSGMPFLGNAVLQGCNWVSFPCLWPCEYAIAGKACQYCFSGGQYETLAKKGKTMPFIPSPQDVAEVVCYAVTHVGIDSVQITGGSTFLTKDEEARITGYMTALIEMTGHTRLNGECLLYITPPERTDAIDRYFGLGASRIGCSLEVWDDERAAVMTPGKHAFTTKQRHLDALTYIAERYGPGKAFSNFIIGLEPLETLREGAAYLAERGIIPSASVWMPFGKPVMGSMKPPDVDFYRAVKEMLAELYTKYGLVPAGECGLNVCIEKDIYNWAIGQRPFPDSDRRQGHLQ